MIKRETRESRHIYDARVASRRSRECVDLFELVLLLCLLFLRGFMVVCVYECVRVCVVDRGCEYYMGIDKMK